MPELPEVETVRRGLEPVLKGARLSEVQLYRDNLRTPFPEGMVAGLEGAIVSHLTRRAKYLLVHLEDGHIWASHLGMTGRYQVEKAPTTPLYHHNQPAPKHRHMSLKATGSSGTALIDYFDPRRFGQMWWIRPEALVHQSWYQALGYEPLSEGLTPEVMQSMFGGKSAPLKTLLMRQDLIAGLGNIYVCEALFEAGLHPDRPGGSLTLNEAQRLTAAVKSIIAKAIIAGGSSISDFADTSGQLGYFQHRFSVYDRAAKPCLTSGCPGIIARHVHSGRSTFYCPECQR